MNIFRLFAIFLSFFVFSPILFGQSLELVEGPEVKEGSVEDDDIAVYAILKNTTAQPVWFKIFMNTEGITEGHTAALCWEVCYEYTDQNFESPQSYTLEAGATSFFGDFSGHLQPYKFLGFDDDFNPVYTDPVPGESLIRYEFINTENEEDVLVYEILFRVLNPGNVADNAIEIINIAPNPAAHVLTVTLGDLEIGPSSKIEIYDSIGNLVKSSNINSTDNIANINISNLSQGIYHLNIVNTDGNRSKFRTIAIQR